MKMEGIFTPIITPHHVDGSIDKQAYADVVEFLVDAGVHCILVGGSTGEYYAQTFEERVDMMSYTHEIIAGRTPLMIGVGATRTDEAVELAKEARAAGADSILINSPPYAVPTDLENAMHALQIDRAANLPIMLYNYPHRTGTNMGAEYLDRVGRSQNFKAIKESSGDINRVHMLAREYPHIGLGCGMDDQALEFFAWGAKVWVCAGSNFLPKEHIALYEACVLENDFNKGRRIMSAMLPLMSVLEQGGKFVQCVKYGCEIAGMDPGVPRPPLRPLTKDGKRQMDQVVRTLKTTIAKIVAEASEEGK
ncbi:MAG: dihydrodipicolinate synthase family protein [Candidatus Promineifilaceae bacterium]